MGSENEKLRALLKRLYPSVSISDQVRIDEALSQQAEPAPAQDERDAVYRDAELYGIGFMVDGVRVHPSRVTVQYSATRTAQNEQKPVAYRHTLHMELGQSRSVVSESENHPFGVRGEDYDDSYSVTSEPLYAAPIEQTEQKPVEQQTQWISVEEQLPSIAQEVIVNTEFEGVCAGVLDSYMEWYAPCSDYKLTRVTHWLPLPSPPTP